MPLRGLSHRALPSKVRTAAAGFWTFLNWDNIQYGEPYDYAHLAEIISFAVLPIAPLVTVPLLMHYARHR